MFIITLLQSPEDVLKMGIETYNKECRGIVMRYSGEWEVSRNTVHTQHRILGLTAAF